MAVSKADLKKNYDNLNVSFDLWKGEKRCTAVYSVYGTGDD